MTLILNEKEVEAVKAGLRVLANLVHRTTSRAANNLLDVLGENEDCTVWVVMTQEEREKWGKKEG